MSFPNFSFGSNSQSLMQSLWQPSSPPISQLDAILRNETFSFNGFNHIGAQSQPEPASSFQYTTKPEVLQSLGLCMAQPSLSSQSVKPQPSQPPSYSSETFKPSFSAQPSISQQTSLPAEFLKLPISATSLISQQKPISTAFDKPKYSVESLFSQKYGHLPKPEPQRSPMVDRFYQEMSMSRNSNSSPSHPQQTYSPPLFRQSDPQWAKISLSNHGDTMGKVGCMITALAGGLNQQGVKIGSEPVNPGNLAKTLLQNNGLTDHALLKHEVIGKLFGYQKSPNENFSTSRVKESLDK